MQSPPARSAFRSALAAEVSGRREDALSGYREAARLAESERDEETRARSFWLEAALTEELGDVDAALRSLKDCLGGTTDEALRVMTSVVALQVARRHRSSHARALELDASVASDIGPATPASSLAASVLARLGLGAHDAPETLRRSELLSGKIDGERDAVDFPDLIELAGSALPAAHREVFLRAAETGADVGLSRIDSRLLQRARRNQRLSRSLRKSCEEELGRRLEEAVEREDLSTTGRGLLRQLVEFLDATEGLSVVDAERIDRHVEKLARAIRPVVEIDRQSQDQLLATASRLIDRGDRRAAESLFDALTKQVAREEGRRSRAYFETQMRRLGAEARVTSDRSGLLARFEALKSECLETFGPHDVLVANVERLQNNFAWRTRPAWRRTAGRLRDRLLAWLGRGGDR